MNREMMIESNYLVYLLRENLKTNGKLILSVAGSVSLIDEIEALEKKIRELRAEVRLLTDQRDFEISRNHSRDAM